MSKYKKTTQYAVRKEYMKKYHADNYTQLPIRVPKELAENFKKRCRELGVAQTVAISNIIELWLEDMADNESSEE